MTTDELKNAIRQWAANNRGKRPTFGDLHSVFGGSDDTLADELDMARQANMIDRDANGRYFII